ncbi:TPA: MepB domain containing protein [Legionella pneumophila]|nr:MepB family protein [Legionella pneumophila]HAT1987761.1 MepB family protein [Legionella pneumophila]HAT1989220.1 MepB family protein [Legionella pneumophila]HAT7910063.1 MepB domain containing protein [Legionella pneumophila]HAT7913560.1 MepB domain containing protein [Legionella pneumophila]HAT7916563.1 MepB domain containing protein [Legionella pneumophila]
MSALLSPHKELKEVQNRVYDFLGFQYSPAIMDPESSEYGACDFELNNLSVKFRVAKITPTKIGQFVTLWKRLVKGPIQPYDSSDSVDFFIINTRKGPHFGQFIFPKSVLCQQGVLSINNIGGKRAMRVYPPWDITVNRQAQKTQQWQLAYFLEIPGHTEIDSTRAKLLYQKPIMGK